MGIYFYNFVDLWIDVLYDIVFFVINVFCIIFVCIKDFNIIVYGLRF